jgi:putative oxidoreductase
MISRKCAPKTKDKALLNLKRLTNNDTKLASFKFQKKMFMRIYKEVLMDTTLHHRNSLFDTHRETGHERANLWFVPIGRFLYALIFIFAGFNHFSFGSVEYAANSGVPIPDILVPLSGLIAMIGGISVLLGYHARVGALLLLLFLIPVTLMMHDFWNLSGQEAQQQMAGFMKNLSMIGGAVLIIFYGAGPKSLDNHQAKKESRR